MSGSGISALYLYLSIVQIKPSRPFPGHSGTESQFCRFSIKIFSRSALAGRAPKFFYQNPNPLSAFLNGNVSYNSLECVYVHEHLFNIYSVCATETMFISIFYPKFLKLKNMWDFFKLTNQLYEKQIIALPFEEIAGGNESD